MTTLRSIFLSSLSLVYLLDVMRYSSYSSTFYVCVCFLLLFHTINDPFASKKNHAHDDDEDAAG